MAANNLVSYDLNGVKESFANWISNLSPSETPFTSMTGKESIKNKYFQWQEDRLASAKDNAVTEGSDAGDASQRVTTVRQNVTQILRKVISVSDTANALNSYGRGKELQYQIEKAGKELKRDIEWALLNNVAAVDLAAPGTSNLNASLAATTPPVYDLGDDINGTALVGANTPAIAGNPSAPTRARRTAGFQGLVAPKGVASPEDVDAIVHRDTIGAALTEADIFGVTEGLYLAGACASIIMFHPKHAKFFSSLMENTAGTRVRMFDGSVDTKVNTYVSTLVDPLGCTFKLIPNRFMPEEKIYFFHPTDWTQMVLRTPVTGQLAKTGSFDKYMIECELGLRHRNQFASGILEITAPIVKTITGKTVATAKAGTTVPFADLFTLSGGALVSDYTYAINPAHIGATVSTTGVVTLAANTSLTGPVTVVATAKVVGDVVSGNGVITAVTAPDLTGITISSATGGTLANGAVGQNATLTAVAIGTNAVVTIAPAPTQATLGTWTAVSGTPATATVPAGNQTGTTLTITPVQTGTTTVTITSGTVTRTIAVTVA